MAKWYPGAMQCPIISPEMEWCTGAHSHFLPEHVERVAYRCVAMAEEGRLHNAGLRSFRCMGEGCVLDSVLAQGRQHSGADPQNGSASARPAAGWLQHLQLLQAAGMQGVLQESAVLPCSLHTLQARGASMHAPETSSGTVIWQALESKRARMTHSKVLLRGQLPVIGKAVMS